MSEEPQTQVGGLVDHLFRHQWGQMVATLTRIFGPAYLDLAQDVVQEAMVLALRRWPYSGIPENPAAWIVRVAKNRALDVLRRETSFRDKRTELEQSIREVQAMPEEAEFTKEVSDDQLRMIFICCHPEIPRSSRLALTLKTAGGFAVSEIARAFLTKEATVAQRLARAKRKIRGATHSFTMPKCHELPDRLRSVLDVVYLMFNEGYGAHQGPALIRDDICEEAIRLGTLLCNHPRTNNPVVHALNALMLFQAARLPARENPDRGLWLLHEQDRSRWDQRLIKRGLFHFGKAASGDELTPFHLEAEIAACHTLTESSATTDWPRILQLYEELLRLKPSPVIALNRSVALARVRGAEAGLKALTKLENKDALAHYYPFFATRGGFLAELNRPAKAAEDFRRALELCASEPIRIYLLDQLRKMNLKAQSRDQPAIPNSAGEQFRLE